MRWHTWKDYESTGAQKNEIKKNVVNYNTRMQCLRVCKNELASKQRSLNRMVKVKYSVDKMNV